MRTDVNACDCTQGCTDTERESALKVDSGKKIPFCTGESNLHHLLISISYTWFLQSTLDLFLHSMGYKNYTTCTLTELYTLPC